MRNNKLNISVVQLLIMGIITCLWYVCAINCQNVFYADLCYGAYYSSIDWLLISFIFYGRQYTKIWQGSYAAPLITTIVAILDNASLLTNHIWHHAFILHERELHTGEVFFDATPNDYFYVHITYSYILVALIIVIFLLKIHETSGFHKSRYVSILTIFATIIILNIVYRELDFVLDFSICFYALGFVCIGYYTLLYNPRSFVEFMLASITERMECALIAFDENDNCIYSNQFANRMFSAKGSKIIFDEKFKKWRQGKDTNSIANNSWNQIFNFGEDDFRFDVHFNKIYDKKGHYSGCYFSFYDVTGDYLAYQEEKYRNTHDGLTGALNRDSFYKECKQLLEDNPYTEYVMVCGNIKGFKLINDMFGVETGDQVLRNIADAIREQIKEGAVYARLEADRFAVFMPKQRYSEELFMSGMNIISNTLNNSQYRMTILMGVYEVTDREVSIASMCDGAYLAIESEKDSFRNSIAYYGDMLRHEYMGEQKILGEFENALQEGQFAIFLQPVVSSSNSCKLAEALVRWIHPEKGIVAPSFFIPLLEKTGYIYKLDQYVWEQAAKRLAFWSTRGFDDMAISVNVSVKDFYYVDIYEHLVALVEKYDINPARLKLEITESVFMNEKERQIEIINSLREYGFIIEIDDFGSGYSSLNMLKEVPANILKMDMAFLSYEKNEEKGRRIVNTIVALAKALDMMVIVEGVETEEQLAFLSGTGADFYQGYYFDRPLTIKQFETKYL